MIVTLPTPDLLERLSRELPHELLDHVELREWSMDQPAGFSEPIDLAVLPYMSAPQRLEVLAFTPVKAIQSQSLGYDNFDRYLPSGVVLCNAAGVHEGATAELALALMLAARRGLPDFVRAQDRSSWGQAWTPGLVGARVLVLGVGGVGGAIIDRLRPFEVEIVRVASKARSDEFGDVHATDELPQLLPQADIVVVATPLTDATRGLFNADMIARMAPGSLLVNIGRGAIVDTAALVEACAAGRIQAALDVMDPEPLPADHPLWTTPGVLISPHVGGWSTSMQTRVVALLRHQLELLVAGEPLDHRVL